MENSIAKSRGVLPSLIVSFFLLAITFSSTNVNASQLNPQPINSVQLAWWAGGNGGGYHGGGGYYHGGGYNHGWGGGYNQGWGNRCYKHCWINQWGNRRCNTRCR